MSVNGVETFVLLFPNEEWSNTATDSQLDTVVSQLRPNISFYDRIDDNLTTLSTQNADKDGTISGFLYVPDIDKSDDCFELSKEYLPSNVTRQANLPPTDFTLVALAPWINAECTLAWMRAAHEDPARAFLFYLPDNSTDQPPDASSAVWNLQDGGTWKNIYQYPVYIIPGAVGFELMHNLALYSGNMTSVPWGHTISELPGIDPRDYVRMYTQLYVGNDSGLPSLWVFLLAVVGVLLFVLGATSATMHLIQRARRKSLERRVASGEVNLEALGIKRLTIPQPFIERLPLFTYSAEPDISYPTSPQYKAMMEDAKDIPSSPTTVSQRHRSLTAETDDPPQVVVVDDNTSNPDSVLIHKFLPYSQPTCPICLEDYESGVSEIRELPCGHIFHPECIDIFLANNSSLCPLCKKSAFPVGYCPTKITNAMVRREKNLRRLRSRVTLDPDGSDLEANQTRGRLHEIGSSIKKTILNRKEDAPPIPLEPQPVLMTSALTELPQDQHLHTSFGSSRSRAEFVEQRIRDLTARQVPIRDPDVIQDRRVPQCKLHPFVYPNLIDKYQGEKR
ncbi:uncharacterized protein LY89DRAFT_676705 [Mollisia scopiformis]|uniref:RING-type domain-containing protein n=1 Tax=Mollisia scopiformis TaxID=149040 RepID=A0A132B8W2_MOLSC|nr:uncharacterized protein LY89DRAFT_676705 [Mollisia scopiformis]KUJ08811.1 hypothetical protein LY89DRAFT_676705 [Mollisia scopiformis]